MIHFTCPGCKASHSANQAFANRRAKCVRCGATLFIPAESGEATFAPYGTLDKEGKKRADDPSTAADAGNADGTELAPGSRPEPSTRTRRNTPLLVLLVLLALLGGAVYFFMFHGKTTPTTRKAAPPPAEEEKPEPPPPPYEFVGPILPPPPPPVPVLYNANRLREEWLRDITGFDARNAGRLMEVQGECEGFRRGGLLTFRYNYYEGSPVTASLPLYFERFRDSEGQPIAAPVSAPALMGGWFNLISDPPPPPLGGRPVAVRGVYAGQLRLKDAAVVRLTAPADAQYLGKVVSIVGVVNGKEESEDGSSINVSLYPRSSQSVVTVICRFRKSAGASLTKFQSKDVIQVVGRCTGRVRSVVYLENCSLAGPGGDGGLSAVQLGEAYEQDLLRYPPLLPNTPPVKVSAEELAAEYQKDYQAANKKYEHHLLEVDGPVVSTDPRNRSVVFETPTDVPIRVEATFEPTEYTLLPAALTNEPRVTVRGEFRGAAASQKKLTLLEAVYVDADARDPTREKFTADFFPLKVGRQWEVIRVAYPDPPKPPARPVKPKPGDKPPDKKDEPPPFVRPKPHPAQRLRYAVLPTGVAAVFIQSGTFAGGSLFDPDAPDVEWEGKPAKLGTPRAKVIETTPLRVTDRMIERGVAGPPPEKDKPPTVTWQPLLRLNAKAGRSWEVEVAQGVVQKTTVDSFFKDERGREAVKLVSVATSDLAPGARDETVAVYVRGVGEVSRVTTRHDPKGGAKLLLEQMLVGEPTEPKDPPTDDKTLEGKPADAQGSNQPKK